MASKPRTKMPIADRAKQFMPFAALKGLPQALAKQEELADTLINTSSSLHPQHAHKEYTHKEETQGESPCK